MPRRAKWAHANGTRLTGPRVSVAPTAPCGLTTRVCCLGRRTEFINSGWTKRLAATTIAATTPASSTSWASADGIVGAGDARYG